MGGHSTDVAGIIVACSCKAQLCQWLTNKFPCQKKNTVVHTGTGQSQSNK